MARTMWTFMSNRWKVLKTMWTSASSRLKALKGKFTSRLQRPTTSPSEPKKLIIWNRRRDLIICHGWAVISVAVSITLIYLNVSEYAIGGNVGRSPAGTSNILGILQLAIKTHELSITASLFLIARQWIQRDLLDTRSGTVLALVGAETSLATPSFLISREFRAALGFGLSGNFRVGMLAAFLFVACTISSLAGPASGVLMIPRVGWFPSEEGFVNISGSDYPDIYIDQRLGHGSYNSSEAVEPFSPATFSTVASGLEYWRLIYLNGINSPFRQARNDTFIIRDDSGIVYSNISSIWGDPTPKYPYWSNFYTISTAIRHSIANIRNLDLYWQQTSIRRVNPWLAWKSVTRGKIIQTKVQCSYRGKTSCDGSGVYDLYPFPDDGLVWCYLGPNKTRERSQNLLLLSEINTTTIPDVVRRIYIVEGPSVVDYPDFVQSIDVVIDQGNTTTSSRFTESNGDVYFPTDRSYVVVCSLFTVIKSAVLTSLSDKFDEYTADYLDTDDGNGYPRPLKFHKHWLDSIHQVEPTLSNKTTSAIVNVTGNFTYPPRIRSKASTNPVMIQFAQTVQLESHPELYNGLLLQVSLGGAFAHILSFTSPTGSQYTVGRDIELLDSMMPEPRLSYPPSSLFLLQSFKEGYGFRLSSRTGIFGVVILIVHMVIVLFGSLWIQFWQRKVISAWNTVPDYLALGIGSSISGQELENTCAGISGKETLKILVAVGVTTSEHLAISMVGEAVDELDSEGHPRPVLTRFGDRYGFESRGGGGKEKLE